MMKKKIKIKKTMTIEEVLKVDPNLAAILMGFGMHCLGCPMSRLETLEEAAAVHNFEVEDLIERLETEVNK